MTILPILRSYDEVSSTNEVARRLADEGASHGTLVVAKRQYAGRGRLGRTWRDGGAGNCIASLILRPNLPIATIPLLSLAMGVSVQQECGPYVGLKWPNDLVDKQLRKVGGILAEMETKGGRVAYVVVGYGINLISVPEEAPNPVSLAELGVERDAETFAVQCATNLLQWVKALPNGQEALLERWREMDFLFGKDIRIGDAVGVARGIENDGALRVLTSSGAITVIRAGDVEMVAEF